MNYRLNHFVNCLPPVLDVPQQIDRRAHLLSDKTLCLVAGPRLTQHLLVLSADAQTRTAVIAKVDYVFVVILVQLLDVYLRRNQNRLFGRVASAGIWIQAANELQLIKQRVYVNPDLLGQMR